MGTWTEYSAGTGSTDQCEVYVEATHTSTTYVVFGKIQISNAIDSAQVGDASAAAAAFADALDSSGDFSNIVVSRSYQGARATYAP